MRANTKVRPEQGKSVAYRPAPMVLFGVGLLAFLQFLPLPDAANPASACGCGIFIEFKIVIDPKTREVELLPGPPRILRNALRLLPDDLSQVREIALHEPLLADPEMKNTEKWPEEKQAKFFEELVKGKHKNMAALAHVAAKIKHANAKKQDRFVELLIANRPDLQGLPFALGDDCRLSKLESRDFANAVALVQSSLNDDGVGFWNRFTDPRLVLSIAEPVGGPKEAVRARIAALTQMLGPESGEIQRGLVDYLAQQKVPMATEALARLTIYSPEEKIRGAAIEALRRCDPAEYTGIVLDGLRYPLPAVALRAADALVKLDRIDLAPKLAGFLDQPDPRAPAIVPNGDKKSTVVRELVRINHHRNCLLCHPPLAKLQTEPDFPVGSIPVPDFPLPTTAQGYGLFSPDLLVRADVTYLRQDFSAMQKVDNTVLWPEMQRFDFLVRTRTVSEGEAIALRTELAKPEHRTVYRDAALTALRRLTGADPGTTAEDWRFWLLENKRTIVGSNNP